MHFPLKKKKLHDGVANSDDSLPFLKLLFAGYTSNLD